MRAQSEAAGFVDRISGQSFSDVFNPYAEQCKVWDLPDAVAIRRLNLERVLKAALDAQSTEFWVGQEPGWRGARRTGLALTDEVGLDDLSKLWGVPLRRATHGAALSEQTAKAVRPVIVDWPGRVFLWNAFHLHTHEPGVPLSNRKHSTAEAREAREPLLWLVEKLKPRRVVAIGNVAADALKRAGVPHEKVRHPSRGGARAFKAGMTHLREF